MNMITLVIFFLTFTTINSINRYCAENPTCQCASIDDDEIRFACNVKNNTKFVIKIKPGDSLQIYCKNWTGWNNFYYKSNLVGDKINSVQFKYCGISNEISLSDVIQKFGVKEINALVFESFKKFGGKLTRENLLGFTNITKLVLSGNDLKTMSNDVFEDFLNLESIDLSNNKLELRNNIFDTVPFIKRLILSNNQLKSIKKDLFYQLEYLEYLDLSNNDLRFLYDRTFDNLISLKYLNLNNNIISDLEDNIFNQLKKLEILDLSSNLIFKYPKNLLNETKELRQLFLNGGKQPLHYFYNEILWNLQKLEVFSWKFNIFSDISERLFWNSTSLKYIYLNFNKFHTLPKLLFKGLRNVEELSLNDNELQYLPDNIFIDMEKLKKLDLSSNMLSSTSGNIFTGLKFLTELNLEDNQLKFLEESTLSPMVDLKIVRLSMNELKFHPEIFNSSFQYNPHLEELYLMKNLIKNFPSQWPKSGYNLKYLDLNLNELDSISINELLVPPANIKIDLSYNNIKYVSFDKINKSLQDYFSVNRDITIYLHHNPILCDCQLYNLLLLIENKLPYFNSSNFNIKLGDTACIQDNGIYGSIIKELNSSTYICNEHEYFNIKKNCQIGCTCYIRPYDEVRILDCSNNSITKFVPNQNIIGTYRNYSLILNLTGNLLTEIPSFESLKPINITSLLLSNNHISEVTLDRIPKSLEILELHNNDITYLDGDVVNYLDSKSLKKFTLSGNPIACDCYTHDLYNFVQLNRYYYKDLKYVKCKDSNTPLYRIPIAVLNCTELIIRISIYTFIAAIVITFIILISMQYRRKLLSWIRQEMPRFNVHFRTRETE